MDEYKIGYPATTGIYKCRVDHQDTKYLMLHYCALNRRCRWQTIGGKDVLKYVEWTGDALGANDLPDDPMLYKV